MAEQRTQVVVRSYPVGMPTEDNFELVESEIPLAGDNEVRCRTIYLSLEPWIRGRLSEWLAEGHFDRTPVGTPVEGFVVAEVEESNDPAFAPGDFVRGAYGWQTHAVVPGKQLVRIDPEVAPISASLGPLGLPGFTGWVGIVKLGKPQPGDTVLVSSATGGVGTVAGQVARELGCRVVGIAGGEAKCQMAVDELGYDACVDRTKPDLADAVAEACPRGIDVNFENVGGDVFWAALANMNPYGRIVVCGIVSHFNADSPESPGADRTIELLREIAIERLQVLGLITSDFMADEPEFQRQVGGWIRQGRLRYREDVVDGLGNAVAAFQGLLTGQNFGKLLVRVGSDPTR